MYLHHKYRVLWTGMKHLSKKRDRNGRNQSTYHIEDVQYSQRGHQASLLKGRINGADQKRSFAASFKCPEIDG